MKKLFLVLVLVVSLAMIGCGKVSSTDDLDKIVFYSSTGGAIASWTDSLNRRIDENSLNVSFVDGYWSITKNVGGDGSIVLSSTIYNGDCTSAIAFLTVPFSGNTLTPESINTKFSNSAISLIDGFIKTPAGGGFKICVTYNQTDINNPIDVQIGIRLKVHGKNLVAF